MKSPFAICGGTGNVGSKIVVNLLSAGEPVRAVARERVRLGPLAAKGAEPWPGDLEDPGFLENVFRGARGAFVLIPPNQNATDLRSYQDRTGESIVAALEKSRIPRVVVLSSIGAHLAQGTGPILGLHDLESRAKKLRDTAIVFLRPSFFMENHLFGISLIREQGIYGSPIRPDVPIPMVATRDIADLASRLLLEGKFTGHSVRYLLGPRDLTMHEATGIMGKRIGKPDLQYVQFPEEDARKAMAGMGLSESVIDAYLEMDGGFNAGRIRPTQERNAENTTPTRLEEFVETVYEPAYRAAA
jgi:uncharacterized protein YbjT (DUF2867 family)